jgi:hypothetical protein
VIQQRSSRKAVKSSEKQHKNNRKAENQQGKSIKAEERQIQLHLYD